jgi:hypothetical protein
MNMSSDRDADANYLNYADHSANSDSEHESSDGYGQPNPSTFKIFIDSLQDAMPLNAHDTDHSDDEDSNDVHSASSKIMTMITMKRTIMKRRRRIVSNPI